MPPRKAQRADGRYTATLRYPDPITGTRKRAYFYGRTQAAANAKKRAAQKRLEAGAPLKDASRTLSDWLEEWRTTFLEASDRSHATKVLYRSLTRLHVEPVIGSISLGHLRPGHVLKVLLTLEQSGRSPSTRRNTYAALRAALDDAVNNGLLAANPASKVKRPRLEHAEAASLDLKEVASLLKSTEGLRCAIALKVILGTGLRRGEVLALHWADVDLDRAEARVTGSLVRQNGALTVSATKTVRSRRTISLSPPIVLMFRAQRSSQAAERLAAGNLWEDQDFVFTTAMGKPVDPRNLLRAVKVAADKSDITKQVGVHTLRHTYATTALLSKVPLHVVSRNLGHSSIAITADIYGHLTDQAGQAAAKTVADAFGF